MADRDEEIRARAYAIWEEQGCPEGCAQEHWLQAASEVDNGGVDAAPASADTISAIPLDEAIETAGKATPRAASSKRKPSVVAPLAPAK